MTVGLKKDQEIKTEKIVLYKYGKVYFPNNEYYNSDPLPIEWLELFEDHKVLFEKFNDDKEFIELQEKRIGEEQLKDPNFIALSEIRRGSQAKMTSFANESVPRLRKSATQESGIEITSFQQSDDEPKFYRNKNAFKKTKSISDE